MLRPTDREMIAIAKTVCYTCRSLKKDTLCHGGGVHMGESPGVPQSGNRGRGTLGRRLYCGFCRKEQARQRKQAEDWPV